MTVYYSAIGYRPQNDGFSNPKGLSFLAKDCLTNFQYLDVPRNSFVSYEEDP